MIVERTCMVIVCVCVRAGLTRCPLTATRRDGRAADAIIASTHIHTQTHMNQTK